LLFEASLGKQTLSQKTLHKIGLVEWLKVNALSSSPSTKKKKKKGKKSYHMPPHE
jgi:hypothetical protein